MKKIAMIKNGFVENICVWDMERPWDPGSDYVLYNVTDHPEIKIDDKYDYVEKEFIKKDEIGNIISTLEIPTKLITLQDGLPVDAA